MKIEKVNDHQIRCTLTKADLADRHLKLSELAYGTEKAKSLFRDMMQQASYEFGFEAEDIPLMIEAIPISGDSIVLIITKVEDPEELDTRFSKFAPDPDDDPFESPKENGIVNTSANDVIDIFKKLHDDVINSLSAGNKAETVQKPKKIIETSEDMVRMYGFDSIDSAIRLAHVLAPFYHGKNTLYKDVDGSFLLCIHKSDHSPEEYNKVCNVMSEYSKVLKYTSATEGFLTEHAEIFIADNAIESLAKIDC